MDKMNLFDTNIDKPLNNKDLVDLFAQLNSELKKKNVKGELCLVGDVVMCLVFKSRLSTHDIDAIFEPKTIIYENAKKIANKNNIQLDWINDSVKGFLSNKSEFLDFIDYSNLTIKVASPRYMLAMKVLSSRIDSDNDRQDIIALLKYLKINSYEQVEDIVLDYYPPRLFQAKSKFFVMELLEDILNEIN